jgi:hypothetical protein
MPHQNGATDMSVPVELAPAVAQMIAAHRAGARPAGGPLEYHTPEPPRRRALADWPMMLALLGLCAVLHGMAVFVVPRYETLYRDFGTKLPTSTVVLLVFARFLRNDYGWAYLWPLALVVPIVVAQLRRPLLAGRRRFSAAFVLTLLLIVAVLLVSHVALTAPLGTFIRAVSGAPAK